MSDRIRLKTLWRVVIPVFFVTAAVFCLNTHSAHAITDNSDHIPADVQSRAVNDCDANPTFSIAQVSWVSPSWGSNPTAIDLYNTPITITSSAQLDLWLNVADFYCNTPYSSAPNSSAPNYYSHDLTLHTNFKIGTITPGNFIYEGGSLEVSPTKAYVWAQTHTDIYLNPLTSSEYLYPAVQYQAINQFATTGVYEFQCVGGNGTTTFIDRTNIDDFGQPPPSPSPPACPSFEFPFEIQLIYITFTCSISANSTENVGVPFDVKMRVDNPNGGSITGTLAASDTSGDFSRDIYNFAAPGSTEWTDATVDVAGPDTLEGEFSWTDPISGKIDVTPCSSQITVNPPTFSCTLSAPATEPENTDFTLTATVKGTGTGTLAVYDGTGSIDRSVPFSSPGSKSWTVTVKDSGVDGITL
ncbi:MAG TPA: hypothetical protein VMR16_02960, partial [Candidatus Saccharimonadales bacterium]|nr:hypothetical protein [Candidatus Saccharimonadales bacterium]